VTAVRTERARLRGAAAVDAVRAGTSRLAEVRPLYVVGAFVLVEWLVTLAVALTVRHNGWLYYQGGDQVWFYTESWFLRHAQLVPPTVIGYGWSLLLLPFTLFSGPDLLHALPAILLLNTLVLMPVAVVAMYGIGRRLGGRLFGYWVVLLWIVVPLVGIKYADAGYHQRYTEEALPQGLGLTAYADFPSMVMLAVSAYFFIRALQGRAWEDGMLAGAFAGFGIGIKPSSSVFLVGIALALVAARHRRAAVSFALGLAPAVVALAVWKWRGLGYLPLFHAAPAARLALAAGSAPLGALNLHRYLHLLDWGQFQRNLDSLREHFWSLRVVEWLVVAGLVALARHSRTALLLVGGWFAAFAIVKGSYTYASFDNGSLFRFLIPAIPPFVLLLAALPLLLPGARTRLPSVAPPQEWGTPRLRLTLVAAALGLFAVVPLALAGVTRPTVPDTPPQIVNATGPLPDTVAVHVAVHGRRVTLDWPAEHSAPRVFYQVTRASPGCLTSQALDACLQEVARLRTPRWTDTLTRGRWAYRVTVSANWLDDPGHGDPYLISRPLPVTIR
jgi:hypothetical protein